MHWRNDHAFDDRPLTHEYIKWRPIKENTSERLNFWNLKAHGETSNLMEAKRIIDKKYLSFIESYFQE